MHVRGCLRNVLTAAAPRAYGSDFGAGGFGSRPPMGRSRFDDDGGSYMREEPPLPTEPPFTAFVVNLSFENTESDVEYFFEPLKPVSVRLVSGHDGRPKGYGYVEFETLDELKEALTYTGKPMDNRNVRVSVAEASARKFGIADDASQWRRSTPLPSDNRSGAFGGGAVSGGGFDDMGVAADGSRSGFGGKFEPTAERPRRGGIEPAEPGRGDGASDWRTGKPVAGRTGGSRFGGAESGSFGRQGGDAANEMGSNWRSSRGPADGAAPMERPKLALKPRGSTPSAAPTEPTSSSRSNPFGNAKPVDVQERERQVQEKLREQERLRREERAKEDERKKNRVNKANTSGSWLAKGDPTPDAAKKPEAVEKTSAPKTEARPKVTERIANKFEALVDAVTPETTNTEN